MNDVIVVIGVGGMGELIARRQGEGKKVLIGDVSPEAVERVATAMRADGYDVETAVVDVSSLDSVRAVAGQAAALGPVREVVHTAGLSPEQASVQAILAVDAVGVAYSLDAFAEVIAEGGSGVYIASMAGSMAAGSLPAEVESALRSTPAEGLLELPILSAEVLTSPGAAYSLAKRANQLRVEAASLAWGSRGARVNSVSPGVISTPMGEQELAGESGAQMRVMVESSGTGRLGTPEDIAAAVAFLLGPDSTFITGTDLLVDGGVVAAMRTGAATTPKA